MNYRISSPEDYGFDDERQERRVIHANIERLQEFDAESLLDTLLVLTKICEFRALLDPVQQDFYKRLSEDLRVTLSNLEPTDPLPNIKLEDDFFYYPEPKELH